MAAPTNRLGAFWAASAERVVHCCASISRGLWELLTSGRSNPLARAMASALTGGVGMCSVVGTPSHLAALMANTLTLDAGAQPPVGVANPAKIEFFVGTPPRRMVIFSGVAVTNFRTDDEDNVAWEDVVVRLGDTTTENFTYTSTVGLASLSCDDSNFNFFADTSRVDADPLTAELLLHVPLGVSGDPGSLNRFSYHVQVLSDPIIGSVMGLIRWTDFFGTPSQGVLDGTTPMFTVEAGVTVEITKPGDVFRSFRWDARKTGTTTSPPRNLGGIWVVPYEIDLVPLGTALEVRPDSPGAAFASKQPGGFETTPKFVPSVRVVELTMSGPSATGVDFDMIFDPLPR